MKMKTLEQFISDARFIHGDKFDYSITEYTGAHNKVRIICPIHGVFEQKAYRHIQGGGCSKCKGVKLSLLKRSTADEFIIKSKEIHGNKFDYSLVNYKTAHTKVKIICPAHGEFTQKPNSHLGGVGCPGCGGSIKKTTEDFIIKARQIHGDIFDYSLVEYIDAHTKVKIICKEHGVFEQTPNYHTRSNRNNSCPVCSEKKRHTKDSFIKKSNGMHNSFYDYSLVEYFGNKTKVKIICPIHGEYEQRPDGHMQGRGCKRCSYEATSSRQELDFIDFIKSIYDGEIITNTRKLIYPLEIDVYLPNKQLAFEYNGEYWHLEGVKVPIGYHKNKTDVCRSKGVKLHHIWERDWLDNRSNIENMIRELI